MDMKEMYGGMFKLALHYGNIIREDMIGSEIANNDIEVIGEVLKYLDKSLKSSDEN